MKFYFLKIRFSQLLRLSLGLEEYVKARMNVKFLSLLLVIQFLFLNALALENSSELNYKYCIPVKKIDFNPIRKFQDGKELAYLMLLRSFISLDPKEPGILDGYEFSPDGKSFTGRLAKDLKWDDGSPVLPLEAGEMLVKTLPNRTIGERIKIDFTRTGSSGVKVIDARTFQIFFETQIENVTGVWREALSTNSRHNRFWLFKKNKNGEESVLSKHKIIVISGKASMQIGDHKIAFIEKEQCAKTDFTIFYDAIERDAAEYLFDRSDSPSAITILNNSERLNLKQRTAMISFIRKAFKDQPKVLGFSNVESFFNQGEPGFSSKKYWNESTLKLKKKKYKIALGNPLFFKILEQEALLQKLDIKFISTPFSDTDVDASVQASGIQQGRHVILQDFLDWSLAKNFLNKTPHTFSNLVEIGKRSASTIPPDNKILQKFEKDASTEQSFAPVARKYPMAYSRKTLPICLKWTEKGELSFVFKKDCGN